MHSVHLLDPPLPCRVHSTAPGRLGANHCEPLQAITLTSHMVQMEQGSLPAPMAAVDRQLQQLNAADAASSNGGAAIPRLHWRYALMSGIVQVRINAVAQLPVCCAFEYMKRWMPTLHFCKFTLYQTTNQHERTSHIKTKRCERFGCADDSAATLWRGSRTGCGTAGSAQPAQHPAWAACSGGSHAQLPVALEPVPAPGVLHLLLYSSLQPFHCLDSCSLPLLSGFAFPPHVSFLL